MDWTRRFCPIPSFELDSKLFVVLSLVNNGEKGKKVYIHKAIIIKHAKISKNKKNNVNKYGNCIDHIARISKIVSNFCIIMF